MARSSTPADPSRRQFLGYVLAGSTLAVAAQVGFAPSADAATPIPSNPLPYDAYDLSDLIRDSCRPTNPLLTIEIGRDGVAHFDLPRAEVGQGITTAFAMIIAEELDLPVAKVRITLADARPELVFNQITGGSTSLYSLYEPVRAAALLAKQRLTAAAAREWDVPAGELTVRDGVITAPDGRSASYGELTEAAAVRTTEIHEIFLAPLATGKVVGRPQRRTDAVAAVTGAKKFATDLDVPNALPTMVHRAPTLRGRPRKVLNLDEVKRMPGVTHVGRLNSGVAVRARTFGQCIDAVRALRVEWEPGPVAGESNLTVLDKLLEAELPLTPAPPGAEVYDERFTFHFRSGSPLETNSAIADVKENSAEVWASLKFPIVTRQEIAKRLNMPVENVKVHVVEGGGSFGRKLFSDHAYEAVEASKTLGVPVRLMWHRTDDSRHGRLHPMCTSRVRISVLGDSIVAYDQRHTSVATDFTHGLGEIISATAAQQGMRQYGNLAFSESIFELTANVPYDVGPTSLLLQEVFRYDDFPTSSVRNIYSPDIITARELMLDQVARARRQDAVKFRQTFAKKDPRMLAVLEKAASVGRWGRSLPAGVAQGIAIHNEYKSRIACLVELDARPQTVHRRIPQATTGPRVTKVVIAVDTGIPINPLGLDAQMLGGAMDGIAQVLTASLHVERGLPLEGSWDDFRYTRQWNVPFEFKCVVMPPTTTHPGGAGELAVGVTQAAVACAYARAVRRLPTEFPVKHRDPLPFKVKSKVPPVPPSPTNGLRFAGRVLT